MDAHGAQRRKDAHEGMKAIQSQDPIVRIQPTAREAHKRSGWPPRTNTPQGRSRGFPMDPKTTHN